MKYLLTFLTTIMAFVMLTVAMPDIAFAGSPKVDVCHIPPGNPDNFHTIRISENALSAHLAHGDFASACAAACATLCNDDDLCTVDDKMDCEEQGCPSFPRDLVDVSDGLNCTVDSCDSNVGIINTPVVCTPSDLCHVSVCDEQSGECAETEKVCGVGEECNLGTGDCEDVVVEPADCPCFTADTFSVFSDPPSCGLNPPEIAQAYFPVFGDEGEFLEEWSYAIVSIGPGEGFCEVFAVDVAMGGVLFSEQQDVTEAQALGCFEALSAACD